MNPNIKHVSPRQPGQSSNPMGRPKGQNIADLLREIGNKYQGNTKTTRLQALLERVYRFALNGESWAVQFIADRTEGKPLQPSFNANANLNASVTGRAEDLTLQELVEAARTLTGGSDGYTDIPVSANRRLAEPVTPNQIRYHQKVAKKKMGK